MITQTPLPIGAQIAPDYALFLQQQDVTETFRHRLLSLTLTDNRGFTADQLVLELDDTDGQVVMPARNQVITLKLGWKGQGLVNKGKFTIDEVEHQGAPDKLTLRARSVDFRGSMNTARDRSYHDKTLGEIVNEIANRNRMGNTLAAGLAEIKISHIDQAQETDAAFITRLATMNGAVAAIKDERLLFLIPGSGQTVSGKPIAPLILQRRDGDQHYFNLADRGNYSGVRAKWQDTEHAQQQQLTVQRQNGAADNAESSNYLAGDSDNVFTLPRVYTNKEAAIRAAKAKWERIQQGSVQFSINLAMGRPELYPEMPIQVRGFKEAIDRQSWIINTVVHTLNGSGYVTKIALDVLTQRVEFAIIES
ncbi:phage late control D family protein [Serratia quinivorans]|uniref:Late control D family protein n=1 Tax=Serratia proteamaculans (strain 568) TaxID=399741 RepID=A8GA23_SERP5|nr:phage late control D family protein [Serratia quinivorans]CAI1015259.1 Phage protein D [Serratia quinivorans]